MGIDKVQFSDKQLEYLKSIYTNALKSSILPTDTIETIMYNAGVSAVIRSVESNTLQGVPTRPRQ